MVVVGGGKHNRPYGDGKTHGLIVDYLGIFDDVAQALQFDEKGVRKAVSNINELERISKPSECHNQARKLDKSVEQVSVVFKSRSQSPKVLEPANGSLDFPAATVPRSCARAQLSYGAGHPHASTLAPNCNRQLRSTSAPSKAHNQGYRSCSAATFNTQLRACSLRSTPVNR